MKHFKFYIIGAIILALILVIFIQSERTKKQEAVSQKIETASLFNYTAEQVKQKFQDADIKITDDNKVKAVAIKQAYNDDLTVFKMKMANLINLAKEDPETIFSDLLPDANKGDNPLNYSKSIERNGYNYKYVSIHQFGINFQIAKKEP